MIRVYAEQLNAQLQQSLHLCYLLFGNDQLLLQEGQDNIRDRAKEQQFDEHFSITLDPGTDWDAIFRLCQARSLFASRQTLLLLLPDSGIQAAIEEKLLQLVSLLHEDLLLILRGSNLTRTMENAAWFKALRPQAVLVSCATPEQGQLPRWVARRAKSMKLTLDDATCQMLCYYYEGNLLALVQALERLSLIYLDGSLTLPRVDVAVNDAAHFAPFHWVDAVLAGKSKRAAHILHQLRLEAAEPVILLRSIQREVLHLLTFKRKMASAALRTLFDHHKVWQNRRPLLTQALERLTLLQLRDAVALMTHIELALKQNHGYPVWSDLNAAFYGGTFDPIHYGHLRPVIELARLVNLQQVILLPNNFPPRRPQPVASAQQRLAMARKAIAELPDALFTLDDRELRRQTLSWTVDTFQDLRCEYGYDAPLGFIIGQDSLLTLSQWHRGLALPDLCHLLVCARPGYSDELDNENENRWLTRRLTRDPQALHRQPAGLIYCADTLQLAISGSDIRARFREARSCDGLLPPAVQDYIDEQGLYR